MNTHARHWFLFVLFSAMLAAGCDQNDVTGPSPDGLSASATSAQTVSPSSAFANQSGPLSWSSQPLDELWNYVAEGDSVVTVGLKRRQDAEGIRGASLLIGKQAQASAVENIVRAVSAEVLSRDEILPIVRLRVKNKGTLQALRKMPFVEYVEPENVLTQRNGGFFDSDGTGCSVDSYGGDILTTSSGDKLAPSLGGARYAWERSTGEGVTVGVVGTGISQYQPQFNSEFEGGQSSGRNIDRNWTWTEFDVYPRWHDDCGHETRIAGLIAAPRDGESIVGVAYRANLYTVRVDDNVVTQTESDAVRYGIRNASQESDIVNMAFGSYHMWSSIRDEIEYWYDQEDALYIGAAGTTNSVTNDDWIAFPARMDEVVAVTGLDADGTPCSSCHYGEEVMFAAKTNEPTLNPNKNSSSNADAIRNIGGSSGATGSISGIAALVRSRYPGLDRGGVISYLKYNSRKYIRGGIANKSNSIGWGKPNPNCAVGGVCNVGIGGDRTSSTGRVRTQLPTWVDPRA